MRMHAVKARFDPLCRCQGCSRAHSTTSGCRRATGLGVAPGVRCCPCTLRRMCRRRPCLSRWPNAPQEGSQCAGSCQKRTMAAPSRPIGAMQMHSHVQLSLCASPLNCWHWACSFAAHSQLSAPPAHSLQRLSRFLPVVTTPFAGQQSRHAWQVLGSLLLHNLHLDCAVQMYCCAGLCAVPFA